MTITVAIKDHPGIDTTTLAAALQEQGAAVKAAWGLADDVKVVRYRFRKPCRAWRLQFYDSLPAGEGGVHLNTRSGRPYAKVLASEGTLAASHEFCEMLVDPLGTRFQTTTAVMRRQYLVEVCDPVERLSYPATNGVEVSDYILPGWYDYRTARQSDELGLCLALQLIRGGYVSYIENGDWWQSFADDKTGEISSRNLGRASLRTRREKDELAAAWLAWWQSRTEKLAAGRPAASTPPKATGGTAAPNGDAA